MVDEENVQWITDVALLCGKGAAALVQYCFYMQSIGPRWNKHVYLLGSGGGVLLSGGGAKVDVCGAPGAPGVAAKCVLEGPTESVCNAGYDGAKNHFGSDRPMAQPM